MIVTSAYHTLRIRNRRMIKRNNQKFKRQYFLANRSRSRDYRYWFVRNEFDEEVKTIKIKPDEWACALNLMHDDRYAKLPIWLQRLKERDILPFLNELGMTLTEYQTNLIQTTYFSWGKKDVHIEDQWIFRNALGVELFTNWWYLSGETSFRLNSATAVSHNSAFFNIEHKQRKKQLARTLLAIAMITDVVEVSSVESILDKFSHEQIALELMVNSTQYENDQLIYAKYNVLYDGHKYLLVVNFKEKYYLLGENSMFYDYLSFNLNCVSKYSMKEMYKLILDK